MFTGIIEEIGEVKAIKPVQSNIEIMVKSPLSAALKIDQSVSHDGVCLTVVRVEEEVHTVVAVSETLSKSNLGTLSPGSLVNLERCMLNNGRFDGHIVQGHVDQTAIVKSIIPADGSWLFSFQYDPGLGNVTVEKGSIAVNGISLTCYDTKDDQFTVAVIPYTFEHTNLHRLMPGQTVNLEFDIIGKYVRRLMDLRR